MSSDWTQLISFITWKGPQLDDEDTFALRAVAIEYQKKSKDGKFTFTHPHAVGTIEDKGVSTLPGLRGTLFDVEIAGVAGTSTATFVLPFNAEAFDIETAAIGLIRYREGAVEQRIMRDPKNRFGRKQGETVN